MAKVAAINISEVRGIQKHPVPEAYLKADWGSRAMPMRVIGTVR